MIAENLKRLRESRNLSLSELSNRLNKNYNVKFSKATLARWEDNQSSPSIAHASALAHFYGITLDRLSGVEDINESEETPIETIAAHMDDDLTEEEILQVRAYIAGLKANRD